MTEDNLMENYMREIRERLEDISKTMLILLNTITEAEEESDGKFSKDIGDVQPKEYRRPSYLG